MKLISKIFLIPVLAGFASLAAQGQEPHRATGQVTVRASVENLPNPLQKSKVAGEEAEKTTKALGIELSAAKSVTGKLKVVTTFYARDLGKRTTVVEKEVESVANLDASQSAKLTTPSVTFTYIPEHSKNSSGKGKGKARSVKVDATGHRYYGWVVRVTQGDVLLGEAASATPLLKGAD